MKEENRCEAKYGDNECQNRATTGVISCGRYFRLCKECAKVAVKQIKLNNK